MAPATRPQGAATPGRWYPSPYLRQVLEGMLQRDSSIWTPLRPCSKLQPWHSPCVQEYVPKVVLSLPPDAREYAAMVSTSLLVHFYSFINLVLDLTLFNAKDGNCCNLGLGLNHKLADDVGQHDVTSAQLQHVLASNLAPPLALVEWTTLVIKNAHRRA
ncbi:hypothetical protein U9M48_019425 [Paspalum notatum var. saurae]|uniref:Uncharacterized protein n=1 Tax=Paspalum notatum var. saurae TaxID=547442 RepID=A0AAQ3TCL8_PASNO